MMSSRVALRQPYLSRRRHDLAVAVRAPLAGEPEAAGRLRLAGGRTRYPGTLKSTRPAIALLGGPTILKLGSSRSRASPVAPYLNNTPTRSLQDVKASEQTIRAHLLSGFQALWLPGYPVPPCPFTAFSTNASSHDGASGTVICRPRALPRANLHHSVLAIFSITRVRW